VLKLYEKIFFHWHLKFGEWFNNYLVGGANDGRIALAFKEVCAWNFHF
jgi:hypothetical protein